MLRLPVENFRLSETFHNDNAYGVSVGVRLFATYMPAEAENQDRPIQFLLRNGNFSRNCNGKNSRKILADRLRRNGYSIEFSLSNSSTDHRAKYNVHSRFTAAQSPERQDVRIQCKDNCPRIIGNDGKRRLSVSAGSRC